MIRINLFSRNVGGSKFRDPIPAMWSGPRPTTLIYKFLAIMNKERERKREREGEIVICASSTTIR